MRNPFIAAFFLLATASLPQHCFSSTIATDLSQLIQINTSNDPYWGSQGETDRRGDPRPADTLRAVELLINILVRENILPESAWPTLIENVCGLRSAIHRCGYHDERFDVWLYRSNQAWPDVLSLLVRLRGDDLDSRDWQSEYGPVLLLSHLDTASTIDPLNQWSCDPYSGLIKGECVYGRGALDMKGLAVIHLHSFMEIARRHPKPPQSLMMLFVPDHERGSQWGTQWLIQKVFQNNKELQPRYVLGEGGFFTEAGVVDPTHRVGIIAIAERAVNLVELRMKGAGGHFSINRGGSAAAQMIRALDLLDKSVEFNPMNRKGIEGDFRNPPPVSKPGIDAMKKLFPPSSKEMPGKIWDLYLWGDWSPKDAPPALLGMLYDTYDIINHDGGSSRFSPPTNSQYYLVFNRIPGVTKGSYHYGNTEYFLSALRRVIQNPDIEIRILNDIEAVTPGSSHTSPLFLTLQQVAKEQRQIETVPVLTPAGTDLRFFRYYLNGPIDCYGLYPAPLRDNDLVALHGIIDEKIAVEDLEKGVDYFQEVLERFYKASQGSSVRK